MPDVANSGADLAIRAVARVILAHDLDHRLPTTQELQASLGVGAGTVQKAFGVLEDVGAVSTRARGHKGRFVQKRDLGQLWRFADFPPVRAVITPPGAREVYGLVRGLRLEFGRLGVPLEVEHLRGGEERIARVKKSRNAFAVVSAGLASGVEREPGEFALRSLGDGTYYAAGSIVVLSRAGVDLRAKDTRLGVDPQSHDHRIISEAEFGPLGDRSVVPVPFPQVPRALMEGTIDAGVWHEMLLLLPPELVGIHLQPLSPVGATSVQALARAVIVHRTEDGCLATVLNGISWSAVAETQRGAGESITIDNADIWYR